MDKKLDKKVDEKIDYIAAIHYWHCSRIVIQKKRKKNNLLAEQKAMNGKILGQNNVTRDAREMRKQAHMKFRLKLQSCAECVWKYRKSLEEKL